MSFEVDDIICAFSVEEYEKFERVSKMLVEWKDLGERLDRLKLFLDGVDFSSQSDAMQDLLKQQASAMEAYKKVLTNRLIVDAGEMFLSFGQRELGL
ncbi:MAG: crAss001_48 related protein [Pontibacterium sp.]